MQTIVAIKEPFEKDWAITLRASMQIPVVASHVAYFAGSIAVSGIEGWQLWRHVRRGIAGI